MKNIFLPILFAACFITGSAFAKDKGAVADSLKKLSPLKKFYVGSGTDAGIFSTATVQKTVPTCATCQGLTTTNTMGTLRFSYVINAGLTFNFNLGEHFGLYTGIDMKNIGFIDHNAAGETVKRRTYNLGVPIGIKVGNMRPKSMYAFFGGGADMPFNYKEKAFVTRSTKSKLNEWFSARTPAFMPYVFAGLAINRGITFKLQYYPGNFLNPDYVQSGSPSTEPYYGYDVHLILFSIGYAVPMAHHDMVKKSLDDLKEGKMTSATN